MAPPYAEPYSLIESLDVGFIAGRRIQICRREEGRLSLNAHEMHKELSSFRDRYCIDYTLTKH